jgi:pimeloyl-ACP methyl ester carboxylesterase
MSILYELRYPTKWYMKLITAVLALIFFAVLATVAIAGFLVYRIVKPQRTSSEIDMESFPGKPDLVDFTVAGIGVRHGWFFPGLRGAPTIVLCHGYGSSRGFVFDFAAHGGNEGITTFGYREADEVRAAVDTVAARNDVDPARIGLWGYNLGAYAALREAENDHRIKAIVLDSVYDEPQQMVKIGVERTGLGGFPLMARSAAFSFTWLNYKYREDPPISKKLSALAGVPKLFIEASDDPELAEITRQMFIKAPEPRDQTIIPHGNFVAMDDNDKRDYENRVVSFFLLKLPATGSPRR